MIGSGLKKLAQEHQMKVDRGVAYGCLLGYAATLFEGSGWKSICFTTTFADPDQRNALMKSVYGTGFQKKYRVQNINFTMDAIQVVFTDTFGTMGKIKEFLEWFLPLLQQHGASQWNVCTQCGMEITDGKWMLVNGVAYYMHESCVQKTSRDLQSENERRAQEDTGSYLTGALGAFAGALLGAVVWAVILMFGYVASLVGLLIGWLSDKGYRLAKGKNSKGKLVIMILAVIFGVVAGTIGADAISLIQWINSGEITGVVIADIPALIFYTFATEPEYRIATLGNIGMGLLFAALGVYWLVIRTGKEVSGDKIVELK